MNYAGYEILLIKISLVLALMLQFTWTISSWICVNLTDYKSAEVHNSVMDLIHW